MGKTHDRLIDDQSGKHCFRSVNKTLWAPRGLSG